MSNWPVLTPTPLIGGGYLYASSISSGTAISSSSGSKGSWVEIVASLPIPVVGLAISQYSTLYGFVAFDIGVGASGSEVVVAPDIWSGIPPSAVIPIAIPRGQRVSIRVSGQNPYANATGYVGVDFFGSSFLHPEGYQKMALLATGTNDAGAAANTYSSWLQITGSLPFNTKALLVGLAAYGTTAATALWQVGIGAASSEVAIANGFWTQAGYSTATAWVLIPCASPLAGRVAFRHCASSTATSSSRNTSYAIYALG